MDKQEKLKFIKLAIVIWVGLHILLILGGACTKTYVSYPLSCISSPINELATTTQKARAGVISTTYYICQYANERFTAENLEEKFNNIVRITFECGDEHFCGSASPLVDLSDGKSVTTNAAVQYKARVECSPVSAGNTDCVITLIEGSGKGSYSQYSSPVIECTNTFILLLVGFVVLLIAYFYVKRS